MKILLATASHKLFDGEAESVLLPTIRGEAQILPGHTYLVTALEKGMIVVTGRSGEQRFEIEGGIAEIADDRIVALAS